MINNHNHKHTGGSLSGGPGINTALNRVDVIVLAKDGEAEEPV